MPVYKGNPTKDGRCYYFSCYKNNKRFVSRKYLTKKEAVEEEAVYKLDSSPRGRKFFNIVAISYFNYLYNSKKESTAITYKQAYFNYLEPYFGQKSVFSINTHDINEWKNMTDKNNLSVAYKNKVYCVLKNIFDFAIKNYDLTINPATLSGRFENSNKEIVKDEDKIRYVALEDFNKFISVIDDSKWFTFFNFLFYTGMRKGEVQALTWKDIDLFGKIIVVNKTLSVKTQSDYTITSTKNNVNRKIVMSNNLKDILQSYKEEMKKYSDFSEDWFVFGGTRFLPQTSIDRAKHKYFELSGVKEITIHEFRHSHVSLLINEYLKSGQTDSTKFFIMMSSRMGHTIDVMTRTYLHLFPTVQNEIVDLLDNL